MSTRSEIPFDDQQLPEGDMDQWFAEHEKIQQEMMEKYKPGQRVKVDDGDDQEPVTGEITHVYRDYNDGSLQSVFVDISLDNGIIIDRVLAEDIIEIIE